MIQKVFSSVGLQLNYVNVWEMLLAALQAFVVVLLVVPIVRRSAAKRLARQTTHFHQTHREPISRLGGVALAAAFLSNFITLGLVYARSSENGRSFVIICVGALAMFLLGLWDDLKTLGAKRKLAVQFLVALGIYKLGLRIELLTNPLGGQPIPLGAWSWLATVMWIVGMTNLINLIDGIDGLAAGICLMLMVLLTSAPQGMHLFPLLTCGVAGALIAFLIFNFPPAKIYMGDGGAYFLGCLIGELTIANSHKGTVVAALVAPLFVLALPILDVSLAIVRRGLKGLPVFRPDRKHIHHRLLEMGLSRRNAVLGMYCFTVVFLLLGMVALGSGGKLVPILVGVAILIILMLAGRLSFAREWFAVGHVVGNSLRMREEVGYAVLMTRWLALEGRRVEHADELWRLMTFAAERMGFCTVRVQLGDQDREWSKSRQDDDADYHVARFDFSSSGAGIIELKAKVCAHEACPSDGRDAAGKIICARAAVRNAPCAGDRRMFEVITELLAEGWHKASRHLQKEGRPLRFESDETEKPSASPAVA